RVHGELGGHHRDRIVPVLIHITGRVQDEPAGSGDGSFIRGEAAAGFHGVIRRTLSSPVISMSRRTMGVGSRSSTSRTCLATDASSAIPELSMNVRSLTSKTTRWPSPLTAA